MLVVGQFPAVGIVRIEPVAAINRIARLLERRQPADPVVVADHDLPAAPAVIHRRHELPPPIGSHRALAVMAEGRDLAAGNVGGGIRRQGLGVDRDRIAGLLDQPRRGKAERPGPDHRDRSTMARQAQVGRQLGAAPAQRDAGAAVTVVVDEPFVAERLGPNDEARSTIGPEARNRADYAVLIGKDPRQRRAGSEPRRPRPDRGAAAQERGGAGSESSTVKQHRPSLAAQTDASITSTVTWLLVNTQTSAAMAMARRARISGSCSYSDSARAAARA